ncbi:MAG: ExeA family protein, partial [Thermomicrobiales bacterium]
AAQQVETEWTRERGAARDNHPDPRLATPLTRNSADPRGPFYRSLGQEDCYERLKLAVKRGRGLAVVIGDAGYGKTTIKQALLHEFRPDPGVAIGTVDDPRDCRTDVQFLRAVLGQFGVDASGRTGLDLTTEFLGYLETMRAARRMALLVIDEGQRLTGSQLEILRTFLSGEGPARSPIVIAIFAEPELEEKIGRKRNLAQRVGMEHRLNPLNRRDTAGLIAHRLAAAGHPAGNGRPPFTEEAIDLIHERSGGVPRAIVEISAGCVQEASRRHRDQVDGALATEAIDRRAARNGAASGQVMQIRMELPSGFAGAEAAP